MKKQAVHAPRDFKKIENAQWNNRELKKMSHDTQYNAYAIGIETNFLRKFELFSAVNIACLQFGNGKKFPILFKKG